MYICLILSIYYSTSIVKIVPEGAEMRWNMARGQRKAVEEKIAEKEEVISALKIRLKSEQAELDALYREKREKDLEGLNQIIAESGLDVNEAADILREYIQSHTQQSA